MVLLAAKLKGVGGYVVWGVGGFRVAYGCQWGMVELCITARLRTELLCCCRVPSLPAAAGGLLSHVLGHRVALMDREL